MKNEEKKPLVSIIIPVYNGSNYMKEAIDSALCQTYEKIEVIVINDGSNDNGETEKIALSYGNKIRYYSKKNGGVSSALNLGINKMKGEYFSWLSHDDKYKPQKIEKQIDLIRKYNINKMLALCNTQQINQNSKEIIGNNKQRTLSTQKITNWDDAIATLFKNGCFNGCGLLIPKIAFKEAGLFDETLVFSQDLLMWLKIFFNKYSLVYDSEKLVYSRIHDQQVTRTKKEIASKDNNYIANIILKKIIECSNDNNKLFYNYIKSNAKHNELEIVKKCFQLNKTNKIIKMHEIIVIYVMLAYGKLRPKIKKIYYRIFKGISIKD